MIIHGDALEVVTKLEKTRTIFADVPDNIGLGYDGFKDKVLPDQYYQWLHLLMLRALPKCDIFWLSLNVIHLQKVGWLLELLKTHHPWNIHWVFWHYTFYQYRDDDFGSSVRPILRLSRPGVKFECSDAIRENSERMLLGDRRAAGLKMPSTLWDYPRVVGNSKERREWHPTQHPEALMERVILFSGGPIVDLFLGSGTTGRVAKRLGIPWIGVEQSLLYCQKVSEELGVPINDSF